MKQWLIGEGIWLVVDPDNEVVSTLASTPGGSTAGITSITVEAYGRDLTPLGMQPESVAPKYDARAQYMLINCIDDDDAEMVADETRSRGIYKKLLKKYKKTTKTVGRQYPADLINYKKPSDISIEAAYTEITKISRKVVELQPEMKAMSLPKGRFQILLKSLPDEYDTLRDAIDAQTDPDIDEAFEKLQEKEAQLQAKDKEMAMLAKNSYRKDKYDLGYDRHRNAYRIPQRRRSNSSSQGDRRSTRKHDDKNKSLSDGKGCFLCDGPHRIAKCTFLLDLRKLVKVMKSKDGKNDRLKLKQKAYNAKDDNSSISSSAESLNIDSNDEKDMEEVAALSKELVSTVPKSDWIADTGASSHMTDQLRLFSGPLKSIRRRMIKVGGGRLYSDKCGTAIMKAKDGECRLAEVLYVPDLGVNLLSGRRLTKRGFKGSFDNDGLYMCNPQGIEVVRAPARGGIYVVNHIASKLLDESALIATTVMATDESRGPAQTISSALPAMTDSDEASEITTSKKRDLYTLWHRRLSHMRSSKLRNLHKVTTLTKPISIAKGDKPCEVCAITKMTNKHNRHLAERKTQILAGVSIDICGPLPTSRLGYEYFLEIIDNYSRRVWVIPLKKRSDAPEALHKWKLMVELQSQARLQAVRSDNAKELKSILDEWCSSIGIVPEYTVAYNFIQNDIAERGIRTTENDVRAMIQDAGLPMEFWPEAAQTDAYVRNRLDTGPTINDEPTSPIQAFTGIKPSVDHLRVWGCKCYSHVDTRSLPSGSRTDKFVNTGRPCVFMGYDENTTSQYLMWAPDRQEVIKHHKVVFSEL